MDLLRQYLWECELSQEGILDEEVVLDDTSKNRVMEAIKDIDNGK